MRRLALLACLLAACEESSPSPPLPLRDALARLNPDLPPEALEDAFRKLTRLDAPTLLERNRATHRMLVDGVTVEYRRADGSIAGAQARLIDFDTPEKKDWLAVNQFTVSEGQHTRRPDVVLLDIGLPGLDGYEVARRLREDPATKDLVLVALTGYGQEEDRRRSHAAGFNEHLVKPASVDALQAVFLRAEKLEEVPVPVGPAVPAE